MMHQEYRRLWKNAGYSTMMGSAEVVKPPPKPLRRVYHMCSAEHGVSNIELSRMKISRFSDLNDPFELLALNLREKKVRRTLKNFKADYDSQTGLVCFSGDWTNPVLWSHYANKHKGICLGFDVDEANLKDVEYREDLILPELQGDTIVENLNKSLRGLLIKTKYKHWEYEDERRLFISLDNKEKYDGLYFLNFGETLKLREVVLGPLCSLNLRHVRATVNHHHSGVTTFKARLAFKFFKVVPDARTVP